MMGNILPIWFHVCIKNLRILSCGIKRCVIMDYHGFETSPNFIMYKSWPKDHFKGPTWLGTDIVCRIESMIFVNGSDVLQKAMVGSEKKWTSRGTICSGNKNLLVKTDMKRKRFICGSRATGFRWSLHGRSYVLKKILKSLSGSLFGLIDTDKIKRTRVHMKLIWCTSPPGQSGWQGVLS